VFIYAAALDYVMGRDETMAVIEKAWSATAQCAA
jgi:hypothetical protein